MSSGGFASLCAFYVQVLYLSQGFAGRRPIGLYRDVWIAAIASSRKSLATQTAAICVRFHGRRVRHVYVTMQITFLARKSALIYRRGLRQRVASLTIDCNGVFAIRAYRPCDFPNSTTCILQFFPLLMCIYYIM